jgi:hypothetical protein
VPRVLLTKHALARTARHPRRTRHRRNPALGASGNGIGLKSAPIAAPAPAQGVMPL